MKTVCSRKRGKWREKEREWGKEQDEELEEKGKL